MTRDQIVSNAYTDAAAAIESAADSWDGPNGMNDDEEEAYREELRRLASNIRMIPREP